MAIVRKVAAEPERVPTLHQRTLDRFYGTKYE